MAIPAQLRKYFWDIDAASLDVYVRKTYVIERLLELGDVGTIQWLLETYGRRVIKETILTSRRITPKTIAFWARLFGFNPKEARCMHEPYRSLQRTHWIG